MVGHIFNTALKQTTRKIIVLSTVGAGSWTVPNDWSNTKNEFHLVGGGQAGGFSSGYNRANGGAGGDYTFDQNRTYTPGASIDYYVADAVSYSGSSQTGTVGEDTWFDGSAVGNAQIVAKGGGSSATSTGTTVYQGGPGGPGRSYGPGGGGGAAGPFGPGGQGGRGNTKSESVVGGGGGGNTGGTEGKPWNGPFALDQAQGGFNRFGTGAGNYTARTGLPVQFPFDGGGGAGGDRNSPDNLNGQNGSNSIIWTSTVDGEIVRIGGGGGGASINNTSAGNGGTCGGGGGGNLGVGARGVIVIIYDGTA